jgi:hypothetical protein
MLRRVRFDFMYRARKMGAEVGMEDVEELIVWSWRGKKITIFNFGVVMIEMGMSGKRICWQAGQDKELVWAWGRPAWWVWRWGGYVCCI